MDLLLSLVIISFYLLTLQIIESSILTNTLKNQRIIPVLHNLYPNQIDSLLIDTSQSNKIALSLSLRHDSAMNSIEKLLGMRRSEGGYKLCIGSSTVSTAEQVQAIILHIHIFIVI